MSNCHSEFLKFSQNISLTSAERKKLEISRDAISRKIERIFQDKGYKLPKFIGQGSFSMGTSIRPQEGFYDLDLGVYLPGLRGDPDDWPRTETIHQLICKAVDGHTSIKPVSKRTCVRVIYKSPYAGSGDISYHIDLPMYAFKEDFWTDDVKTVIGHKGEKQWSEPSNPKDFIKWFELKCQLNIKDPQQLKRIVKYLKAWKDNCPSTPKMPSGMILTVLAAKNYKPHERDDIAFHNTVLEFEYRLRWLFQIIKPVAPKNDLAEALSDNEEETFMRRLRSLLEISDNAIDIANHQSALNKWRRIFGERFMKHTYHKLLQ